MTMVAMEFRFPAGRYHANSWGRHVNEADVEWPPSPWRIVRALIATWHRKIDPQRFPEAVLTELVEALSESLPGYHLPAAIRSHSRHYMPVRSGRADKKVLIFDAFLRLQPDAPVVAVWPEVTLENVHQDLLAELLEKVGYLGRAESWVEARLLPEFSGPINCRPSELGVDPESGEAFEPVRLVAPLPAGQYESLREETIQAHDLDAKKLKKKQKQILQTLPEGLIDAVRLDSSEIQGAGWSAPPAGQFVTYQRPYGCFMPQPKRRRPRRVRPPEQITTVRLALSGKPLPRIEDAVRIGELVRRAAMSKARIMLGEDNIPQVISGHDLPEDNPHAHAFYLPEDADGDGHIDHILVHADAGLAGDALRILDRLTRLFERGRGEWQVLLEQYGSPGQIAGSLHMGQSRVWESATPYLHPWHLKKRLGIEDQLRRECRIRGLPEPEITALCHVQVRGRHRRPLHFHRFRTKRGLTQPDTRGSFWRLSFPTPIDGPLALGFGCHYGLGLFRRLYKVA